MIKESSFNSNHVSKVVIFHQFLFGVGVDRSFYLRVHYSLSQNCSTLPTLPLANYFAKLSDNKLLILAPFDFENSCGI